MVFTQANFTYGACTMAWTLRVDNLHEVAAQIHFIEFIQGDAVCFRWGRRPLRVAPTRGASRCGQRESGSDDC